MQQTLQDTLSPILGAATELVGCGRTDAGVHASRYAAHFDAPAELPPDLLRRLNRMLPPDIAVARVEPAGPSATRPGEPRHARFDASHRAYRYDVVRDKDPFRQNTTWHYHAFAQLDRDAMQACAKTLLAYTDFAPFCKTKSDAKTMRCDLRRSEWVFGEGEMHYHVAADRFLRGMVRLIVGACVQAGLGRLSPRQLTHALEHQTPLPKPLSAPAAGLFLADVRY